MVQSIEPTSLHQREVISAGGLKITTKEASMSTFKPTLKALKP